MTPQEINDGWSVTAPQDQGINSGELEKVYQQIFSENKFLNTLGMIVIRNGSIVAEGYTRSKNDRDRLHHLQSVTKSVTALAFGKAIELGYFSGDLSQTLYQSMPQPFSGVSSETLKRGITFYQLLTMRSGLDFDNKDFALEIHIEAPDNESSYMLDKPMYNNPGAEFYYRDVDPQLIANAIEEQSALKLETFTETHIFQAIGISDYSWLETPEGHSTGAYGLYLKPRDHARIGQLVLNGGLWKGSQVVAAAWISEAVSTQVSSLPSDKYAEIQNLQYGYYWWVVPEMSAYTTWGHGGNFAFIIPAKNLVIVVLAMPDSDSGAMGTTLNDFLPLFKQIDAASI